MLDYKKYDLVISPIITEKYTILNQYGTYIFKVMNYATKKLLKDSVEYIFAVKVKKIRIVNVKGKKRIFKGTKGFTKGFKKAFVTLEGGNIIDFSNYGVK
ncbi:MAG: 50S ribosomal protein L23 [Rickettsia sp.]|nr:50S ribosomal protein L23 [Rickettsia sp.]